MFSVFSLFPPLPPELIVAVELTRLDCLLSQTKHASVQLCSLLAALSVQGKLFNLVFLQHLLFITLVQSMGLVVNIQVDCVQKNRSHPGSVGH